MPADSLTPVAFITGGAKRLGKAMALHLAKQGYDIALHYHHSEKEALSTCSEIEALGQRCKPIAGDLADSETLRHIMSEAVNAFGRIDCLINNASRFSRDQLHNFSEEGLTAHWQINFRAPLYLIRYFSEQKNLTNGSIINIGDGISGWSMSAHYLTYSLSKYGLETLAHLLAESLAPRIRINTLALGATLPGNEDEADSFERIANASLLKRCSNPEEVCHALDFLLGTPTITGQTISLASGLHLSHSFFS